MRPALLLIDAQHDFLAAPTLEPARADLCAALARLIDDCRRARVPVVHVWTTVDAPHAPMPHWTADRAARFRNGGPGHATPVELRPTADEAVFHKRFFSAFADDALEAHLRRHGCDTVILAGVHLRACIRTTAIDAYQRGFMVWIADGAVGDDDPLHGAVTRQYLAGRFAKVPSPAALRSLLLGPGGAPADSGPKPTATLPVTLLDATATTTPAARPGIAHVAPHDGRPLFHVPVGDQEHAAAAADSAARAWRAWQAVPLTERVGPLLAAADRLESAVEEWARRIVLETGKPLLEARREVQFAAELIRAATRTALADHDAEGAAGWLLRRRPHGVVALVTPWNNPLAIPLGKIAPAIAHGNTVVWKPAVPASAIAVAVHRWLLEAGLPGGVVNVLLGDHSTAEHLLDQPLVRAASLTGSSAAGYAVHAICARRRIPFQGELGGNNAAIVWSDTDLRTAAREIAGGGFGSAGQRCTANRRVIVERGVFAAFATELEAATDALGWGDPFDEATVIGPLISPQACRRVADAVAAAEEAGAVVHSRRSLPPGVDPHGAYFPPTIVRNAAQTADIVQEETFGPVVVLQAAADWEEAIGLCNGVRQGLAAALFSRSAALVERFLNEAQAGLLKLDHSTAAAAADAPFGGWKSSGVGPAEHGIADRDFYTRMQAVYHRRVRPGGG